MVTKALLQPLTTESVLCGPAALEWPRNLQETHELWNIYGPLLPSAAVKSQVQVYAGAVAPMSNWNQAEVKMRVACEGLDGRKSRTHRIQSLYGAEERSVAGICADSTRRTLNAGRVCLGLVDEHQSPGTGLHGLNVGLVVCFSLLIWVSSCLLSMTLGDEPPGDLISLTSSTVLFSSDQLFVIPWMGCALLSVNFAHCSYTQHAFSPFFLTSGQPFKFSSNVASSRKSSLITHSPELPWHSVLSNLSVFFT